MLAKVKLALRLTTEAYDAELLDLIAAAKADLALVGVDNAETDALVARAIVTYCRFSFGSPEDYDRIKGCYDEQKAQLMTATGYGLPSEVVE